MQRAPAEAIKDLAPTGRLRVSINLGNVVLAHRDLASGALSGASVDLARELGRRLDAPVDLFPFPSAGKVFETFVTGALDVVFLAIEPARAAEIAFTEPYVLIEGAYMVPRGSPIRDIAAVDRPGIRIGVESGSAYDLFLSRTLKDAGVERRTGGLAALAREGFEVMAGVRQALAAYAKTDPSVRLLDGRFMEIRQAMGTPKARLAGAAYLRSFVADMKASGFVAEALRRHGQADATVAP